MAIFTVVSVIAVGALLKIIDANKKSQSLKSSINNVSLVLDGITREAVDGKNYYCKDTGSFVVVWDLPIPTGCDTEDAPWTFAFNSPKTAPMPISGVCNLIIAYRYEQIDVGGVMTGVIKKAEQSYCGQSLNSTLDYKTIHDPRPFVPITSPDVNITKARIIVETNNSASVGQPRVFLQLEGYSGVKEKNKTDFNIQTTISQRIND